MRTPRNFIFPSIAVLSVLVFFSKIIQQYFGNLPNLANIWDYNKSWKYLWNVCSELNDSSQILSTVCIDQIASLITMITIKLVELFLRTYFILGI